MKGVISFFKKFFGAFMRLLNPVSKIAGLEISDSHLRLLYFKGKEIVASALRLPPGIIQDGKLLNQESFKSALAALKKQPGIEVPEEVYAIITLSSPALYLQVFSLPYLSGDKLDEAAKLNLQIISPLPFENAYSDWEVIGESEAAGGTIEVLSAFADKQNIDAISSACKFAGFTIVAIEPSIIAVARAIHEAAGINTGAPALILNVSQEGLDFAGIKNHKVFFNYFVSWRSVYGEAKQIETAIFQETVIRHIRQVLNFSAGHTGTNISNLFLVTSALSNELKAMIEKNFELKVAPIVFSSFYNLNAAWGAAIGAYRRGLLPRSQDTLISLASVGTEEEFGFSQTISFVRLWRNIVATFAVFLVIAFLGVDLFTGRTLNDAKSQTPRQISAQEREELDKIRDLAKEFNELAAFVGNVKKGAVALQPFFEKIHQLAKTRVNLQRIFFQSFSAPVLVSGEAVNEQAVITFKNLLESDASFKNVQLPITSIVPVGAGRVSFAINLDFVSAKTE